MSKIPKVRSAKLTLSMIILGQGIAPCFAQVPTVEQDKKQLEKIEKRLERIEEAVKKIEIGVDPARVTGQRTTTASQTAAERPARRAGPFPLPENFQRRSITFDAATIRTTPAGVSFDRDNDDLSDADELSLGTDPDNRDTDSDALWDGWEVHNINGVDLRSLGASPLHKDIFVEMDFMRRASATNGLGPNDNVLRAIEAVFAAAPVSNPDRVMGINIHLIRGNEVPYDDDLNPYVQEFTRIKNNNFDRNRAPAFHYMIWADAYRGATSSGVSFDIPHSDFIVTLGRWNNGAGGTDAEKIGTFIHELGHNLGRMHGGSEHKNRKPNHLSVMNYLFQTRGILLNGVRVFDYQRFTLPRLLETNLLESDGLGRALDLVGYSTIFFLPSGQQSEILCHHSIEWNGSGLIDILGVSVDLNGDEALGELLETSNEWAALAYDGGVIGERFPISGILDRLISRELPFIELTEEEDKALAR
jgi:hypothetical protein